MTNPTDPAAVEAWDKAHGLFTHEQKHPRIRPACDFAAEAIQAYGDQRAADERAAIIAWLEKQMRESGPVGWNISMLSLAISRGDHLKGAGE